MDIKIYLKSAMELEKAMYTINKSIRYMDAKKRGLGGAKHFEEPPEKPRESDAFDVIFGGVICAGYAAGGGLIIGFWVALFRWKF